MSDIHIILTQSAAKKVYELIQEEENLELKLRVYITGGGCSGFQYGFTFTEEVNSDDLVFIVEIINEDEDDGGGAVVSLVVDSISGQYLDTSTIDYKTGPEGEYFAIDNPNAKTTCGCGSSFSI